LLVQVSNLARRLEWLRDQGVWVIGAAGEAETLWPEADFAGNAALVVGSEDKGLRALTVKCCDQLVRIPMSGAVASLNVSVATGILLFEARRQRGLASG
jgi:23S rRNA (guanosine2251-2'-O)-methyltransferase